MPAPDKGHIDVTWSRGKQSIDFQYNPTDMEFTRNVHIAEITIPGLDSPLLQFIRGQNETLAVTLSSIQPTSAWASSRLSIRSRL